MDGGSPTYDRVHCAIYSNDALDRVDSEKEDHPGVSNNDRITTFTYLGLTNKVTQEKRVKLSDINYTLATKTYLYDAYGHRVEMTDVPHPQIGQTRDFTYSYDVHGSVSAIVNEATGTVDDSYGYDAYGNKDPDLSAGSDEQDPNASFNPYRYSGKRLDSGSGTYDMGARRFGPDVAHFLQQDLFLGALDDLGLSLDPLTQNRYLLAGANPLSFIEWDGHAPRPDGDAGASKCLYEPDTTGCSIAMMNPNYGKADAATLVHGFLDVVGWIPGAGDAIDFGHGLYFAAIGKQGEAALYFGAAIPVVGSPAKAIGKGAKILIKSSDEASDAVRGGVRLSGAAEEAARVQPPVLFGQRSVARTFTPAERGSTFKYAGEKVADVASGIRRGEISPDELPVQYIIRDGQRIAIKNRSLLALRRAGVDPTVAIDVTGTASLEARLSRRLGEMGGVPSDVIRVRGAGPNASYLDWLRW